ncbi:hypothetical protein [Mesorhizobium sp. 10J20-29]
MTQYVADKDGYRWKKDIFTKWWLNDEYDTIYAWINSGDDDEVSVEFEALSWENPDVSDPVVIPTSADYFCVVSWLDPSGKLHHRCHPVIAWLHSDDSVHPLTATDVRDRYPSAILHPNGEVFAQEQTWPSLEDYLEDRRPELEERERRVALVERLQAEKRAEAAKAEKPS